MRVHVAWVAVVAGPLLACGSNASTPDAAPGPDAGPPALSCVPTSGTRVKVRDIVAGAAEVFDAMVDSQLDTPCRFTVAGDGATRCLPSDSPSGSVFYSDSLCQNRLLQPSSPLVDPLPKFFAESVLAADQCTFFNQFSPIGTKVAVAAGQTLYVGGMGACAAVTATTGDYYQLGSVAADSIFAAGTPTQVGAGRLKVHATDGADGSRDCAVFDAMDDGELGGVCALEFGEDAAIRCLPFSSSVFPAYADAMCTMATPVLLGDVCSPAAPQFARESPPDATCVPRTRIRAVAGMVTPPLFQLATACQDLGAGPFYAVGPVVATTSFAELTRDYQTIDARLSRGDLVSDGLRIHRANFRDATLSAVCTFRPASDGSIRCLPVPNFEQVQASVTAGFSDPACAMPIALGVVSPPCQAEIPTYAIDGGFGTAPSTIYPIAGAMTAPIYSNLTGSCVQVVPAGEVYYALGTALPPASFVAGTLVTR